MNVIVGPYLIGGVDAPHLNHPLDLGHRHVEGGPGHYVPTHDKANNNELFIREKA
jgi:hypothetical protein